MREKNSCSVMDNPFNIFTIRYKQGRKRQERYREGGWDKRERERVKERERVREWEREKERERERGERRAE